MTNNDNMTNKDKMKLINELVSDIDCLEPLYKWTNDLNIFSTLKLDRVEIRHSNMLSWLLNPNELHGLNDRLLKKFLIYATKGTDIKIMKGLTPVDIDLMNLEDVITYREKDNIDILIVSESNRLVLAIENKIGSTEHSNQLEKYKNRLLSDYADNYRFVLIYLTPDGEESSDPDNWIRMNYDYVLEELEKLIGIYKIPDRARIYIEDYIKAIRRSVVEDTKIRKICEQIYFRHKEAFDLIFENKPNSENRISDHIYDYLVKNSERFNINVWESHTGHYVRFTPKELTDVCGTMGSGWANQTNLIGFEFQIFKGVGVTLAVAIGPAKSEYEGYRRKVFDVAIKYNYKMKSKNFVDKWKTILSTKMVPKDKELDGIEDDDMKEIIDTPIENYMREELPKRVSELLTAFD